MPKADKSRKYKVFLAAFDESGDTIEEHLLTTEDYYEGAIDLIDSNQYRASKRIRRVTGRIYNWKGELDQDFENQYSEHGKFLRGKAIHSDGTVIEHSPPAAD